MEMRVLGGQLLSSKKLTTVVAPLPGVPQGLANS